MLRAIGELCRTGGDSVLRTLTLKAPTCVVQFPGLLKPEHREMLKRAIIGATAGRMLREVLEALEAIALDRPLILFLDDLQWVDHATVDDMSPKINSLMRPGINSSTVRATVSASCCRVT
jgi:hypothetical protein